MSMFQHLAIRGARRQIIFWLWVAASIMVAVTVAVGSPFTSVLGGDRPVAGMIVPALIFFAVTTGIGWLLLAFTSPRAEPGDDDPGARDGGPR